MHHGAQAVFQVDGFQNAILGNAVMSFAQVIAELTALTRPQRREVALRLFEMEATAAEASDIAVCEHSAAMGFALLDAMEAEEAAK
jgi:hypothetical protein